MASTAGRKLFVGSLPHGISDSTIRSEFGKFGTVEDVFVKNGCESTRQWAFVTFSSPDEAQRAKDATDRILQLPGAERPCDVMVAKNQGMFGQDPTGSGGHGGGGGYGGQPAYGGGGYSNPPPTYAVQSWAPQSQASPYGESPSAPKKIFVGSLPDSITESELRSEFCKYGSIVDMHLNSKPVEPGRQWAFITFAMAEQAQNAKVTADRSLMFPGSEKACEVTLARHQGMFGKEPGAHEPATHAIQPQPAYSPYVAPTTYQPPATQGPKKIFVGSLPNDVTEHVLTAEFSKYGQVVDIHLNNKPCDPGRNWAFLSFATPEQAQYAKDATDRVLMIPGADVACEVMLAKNQGRFGQDPVTHFPQPAPTQAPAMAGPPQYLQMQPMQPMSQPPPPPTPPPQHLTPWRMYKTAAGLPYYHNHTTGVTQWECPPDLQVPQQVNPYMAQPMMMPQPQTRYSPY
mmetsp:Transcript_23722/g.66619  ORF Transcript_23722/g.66619 Transcript_23722/m.66619 type:complete len:458 (-) Transcript_23722:367-1740(-)